MNKSTKNRLEKKNKIKKVIGTFAAGLLVLGFSLALPCAKVITLANTLVTYGSGQVQVNNASSQNTTFKAFMIFKANKNADGTLSNFAWPSDAVRDAVVDVIKSVKPTYSSFNAQDAADFISNAYKNAMGQVTTNQSTVLSNMELLNKIAEVVDDVTSLDAQTKATLTAGVAANLAEGYWMIVTDGTSIGTDENGTSPIYAISGGGLVTINEKTSLITVDKKVKNDAVSVGWSYGADAQRGQSVQHRVTGNVAANIQTYSTYYYEFEDVMSKGIDYDMGSFKVTLDGVDVSSHFEESLVDGENGTRKLRIICKNLLNISKVSVRGSSNLELTYTVKLNDDCVVGADGNPNDVRIIYSSNPNTSDISATHTVRDYLYTFALHVEKKDRDTNVSLAGAKFTIQATNPDDLASIGKYVQADGTLKELPFEFTTDANGTFNVSGLDAGTYTIHETKTPESYTYKNANTLFTIGATYGENGVIATLTNTVSGNADAVAGIDNSDDNIVNAAAGTAANVLGCLVNVTIGNIEKVKMPLSGQGGIGIVIIIGVALVMVSIVTGILINKKKRGNEK